MEDSICNTSDHLAMIIKMHITLTKVENNQIPARTEWHKLSDEEISQLYTIPVQRNIIEIMAAFNIDYDHTSSDLTTYQIDELVSIICKILLEISNSNLPKAQFNKHLKPYWLNELTQLNREKKIVYQELLNNGSPIEGVLFRRYRNVKTAFAKEQNKAESKYTKDIIEEIEKVGDIDQRGFWFLINKSHGNARFNINPVISDNSELLKDIQKILPGWKIYFNNLFTPKDDASYDGEFKHFIENETGEIWRNSFNRISVVLRERLTFKEVATMIHNMKRGKALTKSMSYMVGRLCVMP